MRRALWFAIGFALAYLLSGTAVVVEAQNTLLMGASFSGTIKPVEVDTNGYIKVQVN